MIDVPQSVKESLDMFGQVQGQTADWSTEVPAATIDWCFQYSGQFILNYCNIDIIPAELYWVWVSLTYLLVQGTLKQSGGSTGTDTVLPGNVSSVKIGDTQVSFAATATGKSSTTGGGLADTLAGSIEGLASPFLDSLNRFRRLQW